jgi:hypothetical protein
MDPFYALHTVYFTILSTAQTAQHETLESQWIMFWKGCEKKQSYLSLRNYPGVCPEGLRNTLKTLSMDNQCHSQDLEARTFQIKVRNISPDPTCSFIANTTSCHHSLPTVGQELWVLFRNLSTYFCLVTRGRIIHLLTALISTDRHYSTLSSSWQKCWNNHCHVSRHLNSVHIHLYATAAMKENYVIQHLEPFSNFLPITTMVKVSIMQL